LPEGELQPTSRAVPESSPTLRGDGASSSRGWAVFHGAIVGLDTLQDPAQA